MSKKPVLLCIMDGFGWTKAVHDAEHYGFLGHKWYLL